MQMETLSFLFLHLATLLKRPQINFILKKTFLNFRFVYKSKHLDTLLFVFQHLATLLKRHQIKFIL